MYIKISSISAIVCLNLFIGTSEVSSVCKTKTTTPLTDMQLDVTYGMNLPDNLSCSFDIEVVSFTVLPSPKANITVYCGTKDQPKRFVNGEIIPITNIQGTYIPTPGYEAKDWKFQQQVCTNIRPSTIPRIFKQFLKIKVLRKSESDLRFQLSCINGTTCTAPTKAFKMGK